GSGRNPTKIPTSANPNAATPTNVLACTVFPGATTPFNDRVINEYSACTLYGIRSPHFCGSGAPDHRSASRPYSIAGSACTALTSPHIPKHTTAAVHSRHRRATIHTHTAPTITAE